MLLYSLSFAFAHTFICEVCGVRGVLFFVPSVFTSKDGDIKQTFMTEEKKAQIFFLRKKKYVKKVQ